MISSLSKINTTNLLRLLLGAVLIIGGASGCQQKEENTGLRQLFQSPPESAKPWVFWYWMHGAYSTEGITADLEAMEQAGIGGAYLMPIKDVTDPPLYEPPVRQLSPEWWALARHAMSEADRLNLKLAMHACDGFAVAGGPWITPELSMQKIVWSKTNISGGRTFDGKLEQPETLENYYRDIAVYAYPTPRGADQSTRSITPAVTTSTGEDAQFLIDPIADESFRSSDPCWIQYEFDEPFTCRSIVINTEGTNHQARRLKLAVSDDGKTFRPIKRLKPPRAGWQDWDAGATYAIDPVSVRYFRFIYDPEGTEPGAEDLDAAKWKPSLKISGIALSGEPRLHHYEGKTAEVWRISERTTEEQIPDSLCVPMDELINLTNQMSEDGRLTWEAPAGEWTILRIGYTSTGHTNYTGGGGLGLECDKFNPEAVQLQFDNWFGEAIEQAGPELAQRVLEIFHIDSWECGSQNWSPVFRDEFIRRRGYDPLPYLPVMTGLPVQSADVSERFLHDIRQTIAELVKDNFYQAFHKLTQDFGRSFSAECVSPTMVSDGMLHYSAVDIPMGEFWLRSPTHDKLNDMLDAISGGHIYGKPIIQAEAFTQIRMAWDEHPAMLKALGDRNYALGVNRFVYHVFTHNPWLDRKPGMTLDGVGLYFQRDQIWWNMGKAWNEYAQRCQAMLQQGKPIVDIAVFTGEETPRRAILPDRLVSTLPGIFGPEKVTEEKERLVNEGLPLREMPDGVTHSANMADPDDWIDPLRGYKYDSFNKDALLRLATVENGRITLPGGASYDLLVLPGKRPMAPDAIISEAVAEKLTDLVKQGATILVMEKPLRPAGLQDLSDENTLAKQIDDLWEGGYDEFSNPDGGTYRMKRLGKGRVIRGPYQTASFQGIGIDRDFVAVENGVSAKEIAWSHRKGEDFDLYFISNQEDRRRTVEISLRAAEKQPEIFDPVTGKIIDAENWSQENGRTALPLRLEPSGSLFVVLQKPASKAGSAGKNWKEFKAVQTLEGAWQVSFDSDLGGPETPVEFETLTDWSRSDQPGIRFYSGTAVYEKTLNWNGDEQDVWLDLGKVANIAEIKVNGVSCGIAWTPPYRVNISDALRKGENRLTVKVANTWANRLIGDHERPEDERITWTTAPYRLEDKPLLEAGLLGPVQVLIELE